MSRLLAILALTTVTLAVLTIAANAAPLPRAQTITLINQTSTPTSTILRYQRAVAVQANQQLHAAWHTPLIRFGTGGWQIVLTDQTVQAALGLGWHWVTPAGQPYGQVTTGRQGGAWSITLSHEILEMLVDPRVRTAHGRRLIEVCDPVEEANAYLIRGVQVADFILPAWYRGPRAGRPVDETGDLSMPGELDGIQPPIYTP